MPAKTLLALLLVATLALFAAWRVTDGFRVVTTEDARRLAIHEHPRRLPASMIQYEDGTTLPLAQALREDGRATIAVFFYTRCNTVCSAVGSEFQQLQDTIRSRGLQSQVRLLSISFDPADDRGALAAYAKHMHASPGAWRFARVTDAQHRSELLDAFGITVIPAPLGEFQHNAAFHIVTPDGQLARIIDYDQPDVALAHALAIGRESAARRHPLS
ncbi:MAG TPA: SCO family protein [Noviherbaspirillum sp.]|uniref:SCO family protein n=1 Tax=Noviherbaspirillum sp. TaxID=1926288 RepID=UPI002B4A56F0|nr:SCO family protein [Noviherbaspirillum sp.]HJV84267.1 SCO family protein [Noviherbaspirillum sp.]